LNLKEIKKRHSKLVNELHNGKRKPPINRNGAFQTYLIEIISKDFFVIYPVIWRNVGLTD